MGQYYRNRFLWDGSRIVLGPLEGHTCGCGSVSFSGDGSRIVSGSGDKTVRVWDAVSGECVLGPLEGHTDGVSSVSFSGDGSRIVSGSGTRPCGCGTRCLGSACWVRWRGTRVG